MFAAVSKVKTETQEFTFKKFPTVHVKSELVAHSEGPRAQEHCSMGKINGDD